MIEFVRSMPFPVVELGDEFQVLDCNEAFLELLGMPLENDKEILLADFLVSDSEIGKSLKSIKFDGQRGEKLNLFIRNSSGTMPVEISFFEVENKKIALIYDLSDQIQKNERYVELREKMVKGMYQQGIAQSAIGVLHNIGNLLTIIKSNADNEQLLSELSLISIVFKKIESNIDDEEFDKEKLKKLIGTINNSYPEKLNLIQKSFQTILETVHNMDDVIKTQQKYASVDNTQIESFKIIDIVKDSLHLNTERIRKRDIDVSVCIDENLKGRFEKSGLIQICSNLIVNAVEAIDERFQKDPNYTGKELVISAKVVDESVRLTIQDNGCGFKKETEEKLFDFGFSTKERGSGFGLHECQSMLKFYGGSMQIVSDGVNLGATSQVILPKA